MEKIVEIKIDCESCSHCGYGGKTYVLYFCEETGYKFVSNFNCSTYDESTVLFCGEKLHDFLLSLKNEEYDLEQDDIVHLLQKISKYHNIDGEIMINAMISIIENNIENE